MKYAKAVFNGKISGDIKFYQHHQNEHVIVVFSLEYKKSRNKHGIKIMHRGIPFNPDNKRHRCDNKGQVGDICNNLFFDDKHVCCYTYNDNLISLYEDDINCIVGKCVVIFDKEDDCGRWWKHYLNPLSMLRSYRNGNVGDDVDSAVIRIQY